MGESASRTRADAVITVHKYEPSAYDEPAGGPVLTRIHVEESFSGDICIGQRLRPGDVVAGAGVPGLGQDHGSHAGYVTRIDHADARLAGVDVEVS